MKYVEASSISQKKIASAVGVSEPTIYRWKKGENAPSLDNLDKLAEVLNISAFAFFQTEEKENPLELLRQIASLGPSEFEILKGNLEALSKPIQKNPLRKEG